MKLQHLAFFCVLFLSARIEAAVLSSWTFNTGTDTSNPFTAATLDTHVTSADLTVTPSSGGTVQFFSNLGVGNSGNIGVIGTPAQVIGSSLQFVLNTSGADFGLTSFKVDYQRQWPDGSPTSITWNYSISGGASGSLGSTALPDAVPYQTATLDLSALSLTPSQSFTLTGTLAGGAPETGADIFFDNFIFEGNVTPIPEPVHYAMILFGLIAGGVGITRRWMRSRGQ